MRNQLLGLTLIILLCLGKVTAQETNEITTASVEKGITGIQVGPGAWGYHEFRLANKFAMRAELGLNGGFWFRSSFYGGMDSGFLFTPVIKAEPRWYYNLNRRIKKGRDIKGNSGNFISLSTSFAPDWFLISTNSDYKMFKRPVVSVIPTWGIRRTLGQHFDYEAGFGIGYGYAYKFTHNGYTYKAADGAVVNLHLRIGYHF